MSTLLSIIIVPIVIGVIASFIVWYLPTECFKPSGEIVSYNQEVEKTVIEESKPIDGKDLKRNVHIINNSPRFAMYNITCFFEFIDSNSNIVYHEEKQQAYASAKTTEDHPLVIPFKSLPVSEIEQNKPIKIKMILVYENRYGTKKVSGPWWIREYNKDKNTYVPELDV